MARIDKKQELIPSIFDRLTDNALYSHDPSAPFAFQRIRELRQSVKRDLENLLNTRFRITELPENLVELESSLVNYGMPDLATINLLDSTSRKNFCRFLEETIQKYEPRFKNIEVTNVGNIDENDRSIRFRIEAVLYANPTAETIVFDSVLEPVSRSLRIEDTA